MANENIKEVTMDEMENVQDVVEETEKKENGFVKGLKFVGKGIKKVVTHPATKVVVATAVGIVIGKSVGKKSGGSDDVELLTCEEPVEVSTEE